MFGIFCLSMCTFVFFFIKETKGATLEEMDIIFGLVTEEQRKADVDHVFHKEVELQDVDPRKVEHANIEASGGSKN
jgi:hypothetical protein